MTNDEKRVALLNLLSPEIETEEVLNEMIEISGQMILNKMYPFGYDSQKEVPARYEQIQVMLAAEIYSQRGAEGQTAHNENGISRTWAEKSKFLAQIIPHCGSVMADA
jgi:hypothetical protein